LKGIKPIFRMQVARLAKFFEKVASGVVRDGGKEV
jgi:hypothetical protein